MIFKDFHFFVWPRPISRFEGEKNVRGGGRDKNASLFCAKMEMALCLIGFGMSLFSFSLKVEFFVRENFFSRQLKHAYNKGMPFKFLLYASC